MTSLLQSGRMIVTRKEVSKMFDKMSFIADVHEEIFHQDWTQKQIAEMFNMSQQTVSKMLRFDKSVRITAEAVLTMIANGYEYER